MNQKTGTWTGETAPPPELLAEAMSAPAIGRDPEPPPGFVVGGYPPAPCAKLLSLRLRDTPDTRRLLEQLKDLPDVLARGGSMTLFVAGEWVSAQPGAPRRFLVEYRPRQTNVTSVWGPIVVDNIGQAREMFEAAPEAPEGAFIKAWELADKVSAPEKPPAQP